MTRSNPNLLSFPTGGGEMGQIIREKDWSQTAVGNPDQWPQSLKSILEIILNSKFPMFLWWESELTCFYNDAYRPSLGKENKHPIILGMPAAEAWTEIWHIIKPLIEKVLTTGESVWFEDLLVPIYRNGQIEDVYWTFSYSPAKNDQDIIAGVIVTCVETTREVTLKRKLQESEQKFRFLADSLPQIIWTATLDGKLSYFNQSVHEFTGYSKEKLIEEGWQTIVHPADLAQFSKVWLDCISTGKDFLFEHRFRNQDGSYRWQLSRARPKLNAEGVIQMWVGSSTDIHDQKEFTNELERQVIERTNELAQNVKDLANMNKELQSFAYISSHDLQEPLRKIQTFATLLLENEFENLSEDGKEQFRRMENAAKRMKVLIGDLLTYSRTTIAERKYKAIDLNDLLAEVKADIQEELAQQNAKVKSSHLCTINIVPFQFRQLLQNLISNSLKFRKKDTHPEITIQSKISLGKDLNQERLSPDRKYCHIQLSDNGIGFEQKYSEQIFELFQRLHGKNTYQGTGIGLAIVKKIVENHHGFITANSSPNEGARFDIYLPEQQPT